jgi:hypothetical protein
MRRYMIYTVRNIGRIKPRKMRRVGHTASMILEVTNCFAVMGSEDVEWVQVANMRVFITTVMNVSDPCEHKSS